MSIPLDRLYYFVEKMAVELQPDGVVIYRFYPNGSKNVQDLNTVRYASWYSMATQPHIWCNDQEPLSMEFYEKNENLRNDQNTWLAILKSLSQYQPPSNLNYFPNIFQKNLLLHSEKRSQDVEKYLKDGNLIPVYYWSHAIMARDWFRYAQHATFKKNVNKQFLIYNRSWGGTREYRLKFSDLLVENGLVDHCQTFCNPIENGEHYQTHTFKNPVWRPRHILENHMPPSLIDADASADFDLEDYQSTEIEVVLETLFDDGRLHLTEKSLRPIACRQPFILAAAHGSLQYLRDYGFRTFDSVWDETYDTIEDPYPRMQAIIQLMLEINSRSANQQRNDAERIQQIADHNHKHFFSKGFFDLVTGELRTNMNMALDQIKQDPGFEKWSARWKCLLQFPQVQDFLDLNQDQSMPMRSQIGKILEYIKTRSQNSCDKHIDIV
jgi:hypothetical protein